MTPRTGATEAARRAIDIAGAGVLLVAFLPLLLVAGALVRRLSAGPALFAQRRVGRDGRPFTMWKLRTMHVDAEARLEAHLAGDAAARDEWTCYRRLARDPRHVPVVGWLLRRTSVDELPQLWNVLRGDMALVGPRPLEPAALERCPPHLRELRARCRPGLTGLWQVSGRSDLDLDAMFALDAEYVRVRTLRGDLRILCRTPAVVASGRGAY